jgi:hypothetical protein
VGRRAAAIGTGERSDDEPLRVASIFYLWASNSVPVPAVGEFNVHAEAIHERCDERLKLPTGSIRLSIASEARQATWTRCASQEFSRLLNVQRGFLLPP